MLISKRFVKEALYTGLAFSCLAVPSVLNTKTTHASQVNNSPVVRQSNVKQNSSKNNVQNNAKLNKVIKVAKSKLGDRYVWGGNGPHKFDCSGFTKYVYHHALHKNLPRLAGDQYKYYHHVSLHHLKAGNLVFFGGSKHSITHVGMYIGKGKMIDAQNRGVIIENVKAPWWHLVGASRPVKF